VDGAFLLPVEIEEEAYRSIPDGAEIEVDIDAGTVADHTSGRTHRIKPFPGIIAEIIRAGGIFNYRGDGAA
ncbi:MAG: 3-isopropylmalate dehydratase small subunit, partial [Nitrosopumilus sp.]|nr:3-isopropylmalate dehydratase small subunit [Nitrosopumilus sp.]